VTLHDPPSLETFALPAGFDAVGVACGLKASGRADVALLLADRACTAAGVFTTNRVVAAPVRWDRRILDGRADDLRAVIANSGCANACTGERGELDTRATAEAVAKRAGCRPDQVLVLSTGVIGVPLDMAKLGRGIGDAFERLGRRESGAMNAPAESRHSGAVRAIMTTDTRPKTAAAEVQLGGRTVTLRGFAKGAGMIHPNMATMLAVLTTDAAVEPIRLRRLLRSACDRSFNRVSVDGDMSTNDTVLLLASGASGVTVGAAEENAFAAALTALCVSLAKQIAADGEGATRLVEVRVRGAATEQDAHAIADAIARSPLVKTAIHGGDPNWGRVLAAAGACGVDFDAARAALRFGEGASAVTVVEGGVRARFDDSEASARLRSDEVVIDLEIGEGKGEAVVWTCDLSAAYVSINADYTT
jgi:glutamate N-acetyltransferase/amino-acid N-acetyltransferase